MKKVLVGLVIVLGILLVGVAVVIGSAEMNKEHIVFRNNEQVNVVGKYDTNSIITLNNSTLCGEDYAIRGMSCKVLTIILESGTNNIIENSQVGIWADCPVNIVGKNGSTLTFKNCQTAISCNSALSISYATIVIESCENSNGIIMDTNAKAFSVKQSTINITSTDKCINIKSQTANMSFDQSTIKFKSTTGYGLYCISKQNFDISQTNIDIDSDWDCFNVGTNTKIENSTIKLKSNHIGCRVGGKLTITKCDVDIKTYGEFYEDLDDGQFIYVPENMLLDNLFNFLDEYYGQYVKVPADDMVNLYYPTFNRYSVVKSKAIKTDGDLLIKNSKIDIVANDDAIKSDSSINIDQSQIDIWTCDDGISANDCLQINDTSYLKNQTSITIRNAFEALEGHRLFINGGNNNIHCFDDALISKLSNDMFNKHGLDYIPQVCINGGVNYIYSSRDDCIDSDGDLLINGGELYCFNPYGMLSYLCTNTRYTFDGSKSYCGRLEIKKGAKFLFVGCAKSTNIPTLSSEQNCIMIDIKWGPQLSKGTNMAIYQSSFDDCFVFQLPFNYYCVERYNEIQDGSDTIRSVVDFPGFCVYYSSENVQNGNFDLYYGGEIDVESPKYAHVSLSSGWNRIGVGSLSFDNDTTQIYSNIFDTSKVGYGRTQRARITYNGNIYEWVYFYRGIKQKDGTKHEMGLFTKE